MKKYQILVPEYVPLSNKGEEAIVRGIADSLFPDGNCEISLFDMEAKEYRFQDGIHVYPGRWFFPEWVMRDFGLGASWEKLRDSCCSLLRHILNRVYPGWVNITPLPLQQTVSIMRYLRNGHPPRNEKELRLKQLLDCDFVIAGHDGGLDEWVCHVIRIMRDTFNIECGVYGVQLRSKFNSRAIMELHSAEFKHCHFFYCRDAATYEGVKHNFPGIEPQVAPDPAFAMRPADRNIVDQIIVRNDLQELFKKPVVMCTCCEPAPIARHCFDKIINPERKLQAHRDFFAALIRHIADNYDVNMLFLPHALGPGHALDDRVVAKDILQRAKLPHDRAQLLNTELSAKELKGLIGRAEFLVAERIHSIIGAAGVATPFLCLGSQTDIRVSCIIGQMLGLPDSVYYLHSPVKKDVFEKFDSLWEKRARLKVVLNEKRASFMEELSNTAKVIKAKIKWCCDKNITN